MRDLTVSAPTGIIVQIPSFVDVQYDYAPPAWERCGFQKCPHAPTVRLTWTVQWAGQAPARMERHLCRACVGPFVAYWWGSGA